MHGDGYIVDTWLGICYNNISVNIWYLNVAPKMHGLVAETESERVEKVMTTITWFIMRLDLFKLPLYGSMPFVTQYTVSSFFVAAHRAYTLLLDPGRHTTDRCPHQRATSDERRGMSAVALIVPTFIVCCVAGYAR